MQEYIIDRVMHIADYIINTHSTVRHCATVFNVSKSTVHTDLNERLQQLDGGMFNEIKVIMENNFNERHIRGGQSTKEKYLKINGNKHKK